MRTARAKGLSEWRVIRGHALSNALIPVVTVLGLQLGTLIGGAVITEYVFALPGVGRLVVDAVFARDYPLVQGVVLLIAVGFIASNLLVDLLYGSSIPASAHAGSTGAGAGRCAARGAGAPGWRRFGAAVLLIARSWWRWPPRWSSPHDPLQAGPRQRAGAAGAAPICSAPTTSGATCCRA